MVKLCGAAALGLLLAGIVVAAGVWAAVAVLLFGGFFAWFIFLRK